MKSVARPRGPLPARTYWVRRLLVLATALALVIGVNNLVTRGGDPSDSPEPDRAFQAAATDRGSKRTPSGVPPGVRTKPVAQQGGKKATKPKKAPLPQPEAACLAEDIAVLPVVKEPVAGSPVRLSLRLSTIATPACYWHVSPDTVTLTITSGKDAIWSSRECRRSMPASDVVLRQATPLWVHVRWSSRRSDEDCSNKTLWALPGYYHLKAAALAGEPEDVQFELLKPKPKVITKGANRDVDAKPDDKSDGSRDSRGGGNGGGGEPSGAVEPDELH